MPELRACQIGGAGKCGATSRQASEGASNRLRGNSRDAAARHRGRSPKKGLRSPHTSRLDSHHAPAGPAAQGVTSTERPRDGTGWIK